MTAPLRVLILENGSAESERMLNQLRRDGFDPQYKRVETEEEYRNHLEPVPDIVLADYQLPQFDVLRALSLLQERELDVPFIVLSDAIGEEVAVLVMQLGAADFLLKDRLQRLGPAVRRALERKQFRKGKQRVEKLLQESERKFRSVAESASDAIISINSAATIIFSNESAKTMFGYTEEEILGKPVTILTTERHNNSHRNGFERLSPAGKPPILGKTIESYGLRKDGTEFPLEFSFASWETGGEIFYTAIIRDITDRKQAEHALSESEQKYRHIVGTATEGIWIIDNDSKTVFVNPKMAEMLDYTVEEMIGRSFFDFMDPKVHALAETYVERQRRGIKEQHDIRLRRKNGEDCWAIVSTTPLFDEHGNHNGALGMFTDITERKHLEEQFQLAQKMEAIARLAGGTAHDFNNVLTGIIGYTQLLQDQVQPDSAIGRDLTNIDALAQRAAGLTRQLLAFGRRQVLEPMVININPLVENTAKMARRLIGEQIDLELILAPDLGHVRADPGQIEQVLMNLMINAQDAMPGGGRLLIETANAMLDEEYGATHVGAAPGPNVMLAVTDTGSGMDKATRERIFEPFFTTKATGKGTGLGLPAVYGIVKQHGGSIFVYSEPGRGSAFKIYLPRVEAAAEFVAPLGKEQPVPRGSETILLVEDEAVIRLVCQKALEGQGYTVYSAANPEEGEALFSLRHGEIALLLTDLIMPGQTGEQLYKRLMEKNPTLKVLYMSGYSDVAVSVQTESKPIKPYLQKPFTPNALARKVREVLG